MSFAQLRTDASAHASVWIGNGPRHPAPSVPRPNLYHAMGEIKLDQVFSLTPAGSMGMSDNKVEAGHFDTPRHDGHGPDECPINGGHDTY